MEIWIRVCLSPTPSIDEIDALLGFPFLIASRPGVSDASGRVRLRYSED